MAEIDHLVFAARELSEGVAHVTKLTGVEAAPGGPHPGVGTHNALLSLGDTVYLEIIAPDPNQPDPDGPRPFGIDTLAAPKLVTFAIHPTAGETIDDLIAVMRRHDHDPGDLRSMSRQKPDGELLEWMLTHKPAYGGGDADGLEPFIIDWGTSTHPATVTPTGCTLVGVEGTSPNGAAYAALHRDLGLPTSIATGDAALRATLDTPNGRVTLS